MTTQNRACFDPDPSDSFKSTRKKAIPRIEIIAELMKKIQYFNSITELQSCRDIIMALEYSWNIVSSSLVQRWFLFSDPPFPPIAIFTSFFFNLVWFCLYAYLHVVLLPALKICNFKWQNLYGMKKQKKILDFSSYFNRTREQIRTLKFRSRRSFQGEGH